MKKAKMPKARFAKGDRVEKLFHGTNGYLERAPTRVHHVSKGVAYLDDGQGGYETGVTYDAVSGQEIEMFFRHVGIWSEILHRR